MKVYQEISIRDFEGWSGAEETQSLIVLNDKEEEFDSLIEELYPEGIEEVRLNDILRFDSEWVLEVLGITEEEEEEDFD
jgi:hypothetical protein